MKIFTAENWQRARKLSGWAAVVIVALIVVGMLGSLAWRLANPPISPLANEEDPRSTIQIEIVNASGRKGAGKRALDYFRKRGFDVVEISSSTDRPRRSTVIDRMGDKQSALKVASALGIPDSLVVSGIDSLRFLRASVVLGSDLDKLTAFSE
jgi:hypothetical protein